MNVKKLNAFLMLAWTFLIHLLSRFFLPKKNPLLSFKNYYAAEGIHPRSSVLKDKMFLYSQCLNCSLCDFACQQPNLHLKPSYMMTSLFRNPQNYPLLDSLDAKHCEECADCETYCPKNIPIASFVRILSQTGKIAC